LQAVEKLFNANKELGLDAFKSSLTLPGLTLQLMFSDLPPGVYFTLINQSNSDLHQLIKKNVCGGSYFTVSTRLMSRTFVIASLVKM